MKRKIGLVLIIILLFGFAIPEPVVIPVQLASANDWHRDTFWYEPWGTSGVHKGIDIFAKKHTPVLASSHLIILYRGELSKGGRVIVALGPKWRIHYFAHLATVRQDVSTFVRAGTNIGAVGDSGNAKGKAPHLHYSLLSVVPMPWRIDSTTQGYKKAFYLDPTEYFGD